VVEECRELRARGYRLALDDFTPRPGYERLVRLADITKLDVMLQDEAAWRGLASALKRRRQPALSSPF
jgi:EAL and modified HD-GYP domain-containing signal transduction protein